MGLDERSEFKASIAWDLSCCPIHLNQFIHMHVSTLLPIGNYPSYLISRFLVTLGIICLWVADASAQLFMIMNYNLINGICNEK